MIILSFLKSCVVSQRGKGTLGFDFVEKKGGVNPMFVISPVISEKSHKFSEPPNENNNTYLIKLGKLINENCSAATIVLGKCVLFSKCSFSSFDLSFLNGKRIRIHYFKFENFRTFLGGWHSPQ